MSNRAGIFACVFSCTFLCLSCLFLFAMFVFVRQDLLPLPILWYSARPHSMLRSPHSITCKCSSRSIHIRYMKPSCPDLPANTFVNVYLYVYVWTFQGMVLHPPLHHSVVAIEKGAFGSPLTTVAKYDHLFACITECTSVHVYFCVPPFVCLYMCVGVWMIV